MPCTERERNGKAPFPSGQTGGSLQLQILLEAREKIGCGERVQVGEENVTTRRVAVYPEPLGGRATEILPISLLLYEPCDTSVEYASCGTERMWKE